MSLISVVVNNLHYNPCTSTTAAGRLQAAEFSLKPPSGKIPKMCDSSVKGLSKGGGKKKSSLATRAFKNITLWLQIRCIQ